MWVMGWGSALVLALASEGPVAEVEEVGVVEEVEASQYPSL
jgi:hypothetical protein